MLCAGSGAPAPFGQPALPPGSATSGWSSLQPPAAPPLFPNFGVPPQAAGSPHTLGLSSAAGVGSNPDVTSLLALLAARQPEAAGTGQAEQAGAAAAAAPKDEPVERPADLQQLLTALQLLQQLQQSITNVVVAQLQQHLARQEVRRGAKGAVVLRVDRGQLLVPGAGLAVAHALLWLLP